MNNGDKIIINGIEINTQEADRIIKRIIMKEKINIKSKELTDGQMVNAIKRMIEEASKCY